MPIIRFKIDRNNEHRSWQIARADTRIFVRWMHRELTTLQACILIAMNNELDVVTEEDFIETAHSLGYYQSIGRETARKRRRIAHSTDDDFIDTENYDEEDW